MAACLLPVTYAFAADPSAGCRFYVPFDGTVNATASAGDADPIARPTSPRFTAGVRGKALQFGPPDPALEYAALGNFGSAGTISLWLRLDKPEPLPRPIISHRGSVLTLRSGQEGQLTLSSRLGSGNFWGSFAGQRIRPLVDVNDGQWHHYAISWNTRKASFYFDGSFIESWTNEQGSRFLSSADQPGRITIGPWFAADALEGMTWTTPAVDELMIFDRVMDPENIAGLYNRDAETKIILDRAQTPPIIAAPRLNKPPKIDGRIDPGEWDVAMPIVKLIDATHPDRSLAYPPSQIYVAHDHRQLYIAARTFMPKDRSWAKGAPRSSPHDPDVVSWPREAWELYLSPDGGKTRFRFEANPEGGYSEWRNDDHRWYAPWSQAGQVVDTIDVKRYWDIEIAVPFASLGVAAPGEGDRWLMNFCRTQTALDTFGVTSWMGTPTYADWPRMGTLWFTSRPLGVAVDAQSDPTGGKFFHKLKLSNHDQRPVTFKYRVVLQAVTEAGDLAEEKAVTLAPGQQQTIEIGRTIASGVFRRIAYRLTADDAELPLFEQAIPYRFTGEKLMLTSLPSYGKLLVEAAASEVDTGAEGRVRQRELRLVGPSGQTLAVEPLEPQQATSTVFPISMDRPGTHHVLLTSRGADGHLDEDAKASVDVPGRQPWMTTAPLMTDEVLPPFTPLRSGTEGDRIVLSCWGRRYEFGGQVFPTNIDSRDRSLLAGPIQLEVDGELVAGRTELTSSKKTRVELNVSGEGKVRVSGGAWIEYDGVLYYTLDFKAVSPIGQMTLRIPVKSEHAKLYHLTSGGLGWGSYDGYVDRKVSFPWQPYVWVGDHERGLFWFSESDRGWVNSPAKPITIEPDGERTWVKIQLATRMAAGQQTRIAFGLLATPIKPLPANFPLNVVTSFHESEWLAMDPPFMGYAGICFGDQPALWWHRPGDFWAEYLRNDIQRHRQIGKKLMPYVTPISLPDDDLFSPYFVDEWKIVPAARLNFNVRRADGKPGASIGPQFVCSASRWFGYAVHLMQKVIDTYGVDGLYFDFGSPVFCSNEHHGCRGRYPILAMREMYRRVAAMCIQAGRPQYVIMIHNSTNMCVPAATFVTHFLNGEHWRASSGPWMRGDNDYVDDHAFMEYEAQHNSHPWGITTTFLAEIDQGERADERSLRLTRSVMACTLPHATLPNGVRVHSDYFRRLCLALEGFGAVVATSEFVGYWKAASYVDSIDKPQTTKLSLWKHLDGQRALLIVANLEKQNNTIRLRLAPEAFGWSKLVSAVNRFEDDHCAVEKLDGNVLTVSVVSHGVALVEVSGN